MRGLRTVGRGLALLVLAVGLALVGASAASAGPPFTIVVTPATDLNPVGTSHTVTATATDAMGNPAGGFQIIFRVSGANTAAGPRNTNASGQAFFTYTGNNAGTDTIIAHYDLDGDKVADPGEPQGTATKTWEVRVPTTLTLTPKTATNPVDTRHCVTATVRDQFGDPVSGVRVIFSVSGSVITNGRARTNASGQATFCYTGPPLPGADMIHAFADTNENRMQDAGEPFDDATKEWVLPMSTPGCEIKITNGVLITAMNGDKATAGGNAQVDADGNVSGQEEYQDHGPADPFNLHGNVLVVVCNGATSATIFGEATIDGMGPNIYRIDVEDNGEPGKGADKYQIRVNTYDSGLQTLEGGNVQIHES